MTKEKTYKTLKNQKIFGVPKTERFFSIFQEHEKCIGCGACASVCPENWTMTSDGKAKPKKTTISEKEFKCNKNAQDSCPVQCIHVK